MLTRCPALRSATVSGGGTSATVNITFKGLGAYDYPTSLVWPPPDDASVKTGPSNVAAASTHSSPITPASEEYVTRRRSPFSVLRSRQCRVNRCAASVVGPAFNTATQYDISGASRGACGQPYCCCSALLYPTSPGISLIPSLKASPLSVVDAAERVRDDFLWALKIAGVEELLRSTLGTELHSRLFTEVGVPDVTAAVLSCSDPLEMAAIMADPSKGKRARTASAPCATPSPGMDGHYVARLLLNADEDNRIKWLQEEGPNMEPADFYSRAPSLRALFIMWSILQWQQREQVATWAAGGDEEDEDSEVFGPLSRQASRPTPRHTQGFIGPEHPAHGGGNVSTNGGGVRAPRGFVPSPRLDSIEHVLLRMAERRVEVGMADIAALAALGVASMGTSGVPEADFWTAIARLLKPANVRAASAEKLATPAATESNSEQISVQLTQILLLSFLLRYLLLVRAKRTRMAAVPAAAATLAASTGKLLLPISAFEATSEVIQLRKSLTDLANVQEKSQETSSNVTNSTSIGSPAETTTTASVSPSSSTSPPLSAFRETLLVLSEGVLRHTYEMAEESHVSSTSPHLPELTAWLLREMVSSPACAYHFKRLVDRSITEALVALEKSGLISRTSLDLKVVVRQLLPLLESCGNEDLYTSVLRDVLAALEERARRDRFAFSKEDLRNLAELGTTLFSSGATDTSAGGYGLFDETARGQMEELHVMDGSPWALCVSSYRSLKEMMQGIARDQRRLKDQVQEQLRQLSTASSLTAVMTGSIETREKTAGGAVGVTTPTGGGACASGQDSAQASGSADMATASTGDADTSQTARASTDAITGKTLSPTAPPRIPISPMLRQRFLILIEDLVKAQVDETTENSERPIVVSSELFTFVTQHVPVPNIQDEYRRKIFLLVNVAEDPETTRLRMAQRRAERLSRQQRTTQAADSARSRRRLRRRMHSEVAAADSVLEGEKKAAGAGEEATAEPEEVESEMDMDPHGGANDIPAELRFLVSSLPLTLSPWACVMILREVLAESAGRNPRYTYVLNAAIDLQLPISTTRSRIATTLNMWRFLNTQSHKLSLKESLVMKQRCAWNLPMSYVLSSYWSLLTWITLASIVALNVVGIDWESQIVANSLFRMFAPSEEVCAAPKDGEDDAPEAWTTQAAADLAADYFEQAEIAERRRKEHNHSSANIFLSSASYLIFGYDDQRRPMTVIPISSDSALSHEVRSAQEYAAATAVLRELSLHAPFPFFVDFERPFPLDLVESRIAERIRRISFNNTWLLPRMVIRTFPLGRYYTEHKLILHTCAQANLTRRRVTFLLYMHEGTAVTPQLIQKLKESYLSKHANLVLVVHESSLTKGCTSTTALAAISEGQEGRGVVDGVRPEDRRETNPTLEAANANADLNRTRVLPLCRQFYNADGTTVSEGVWVTPGADPNSAVHTGQATPNAKAALQQQQQQQRWCDKVFPWYSRRTLSKEELAGAQRTARVELPPFAAAFNAQRTSLHRSRHHTSMSAEEEAAAAAAAPAVVEAPYSLFSGLLTPVRLVQRFGRELTGATAAVVSPVVHGAASVFWPAEEETKEEVGSGLTSAFATESRTMKSADGEMKAAARPSSPASTEGPGNSADNFEDQVNEGLVSVSLTALQRMMADVSAPVPMPWRPSTASTHAAAGGRNTTGAGTKAGSSTSSTGVSTTSPESGNDATGGTATSSSDNASVANANTSTAAAAVKKTKAVAASLKSSLQGATSVVLSSADEAARLSWARLQETLGAEGALTKAREEAAATVSATSPKVNRQRRRSHSFTVAGEEMGTSSEFGDSGGRVVTPPSPKADSPRAPGAHVLAAPLTASEYASGEAWKGEWEKMDAVLQNLRHHSST